MRGSSSATIAVSDVIPPTVSAEIGVVAPRPIPKLELSVVVCSNAFRERRATESAFAAAAARPGAGHGCVVNHSVALSRFNRARAENRSRGPAHFPTNDEPVNASDLEALEWHTVTGVESANLCNALAFMATIGGTEMDDPALAVASLEGEGWADEDALQFVLARRQRTRPATLTHATSSFAHASFRCTAPCLNLGAHVRERVKSEC
jgi:hypothetical protein